MDLPNLRNQVDPDLVSGSFFALGLHLRNTCSVLNPRLNCTQTILSPGLNPTFLIVFYNCIKDAAWFMGQRNRVTIYRPTPATGVKRDLCRGARVRGCRGEKENSPPLPCPLAPKGGILVLLPCSIHVSRFTLHVSRPRWGRRLNL